MVQAMHSTTLGFSTTGMTITLLADSYFAMKYQSSDKLEFCNFELFAQESWTQSVFGNSQSLGL